jgi:hypothetical protein
LKRSITETKWKEARVWADVKVTHKKCRYSRKERQRPDFIPANANKQLAIRFYVPVEERPLSHWPVPRVDEEPTHRPGWWCRYKAQTREHLFKNCPHWERQQKILWAEDTGRGKDRFKIRDLFADERCNQAVLDFLSTTDVGGE